MAKMPRSHCIDPQDRIDAVINIVENLIVEGATYTAACGISIDGDAISVAYDPETLDCVDGVLTVIGGGGGPGDPYTASPPIVLTGQDFSLNFGDGLENVADQLVVKAHTYIDVTGNGVAVDFTEVANYNGSGDQYLRNNGGTFQWATLPSSGSGYDTIQDEGVPLTQRSTINFIGEIVTATDNAGLGTTDVTFLSMMQRGRATTGFTAATGFDPADRGTGFVQFYNDDGSEDGDPIEVSNQFFDTFDNRSVVWCYRNVDPPELVSVGCTKVPE